MKKLPDYFNKFNRIKNLLSNHNAPIKIIESVDEIGDWQQKRAADLQSKERNPDWADIGVILDDPYVLMFRDLVEFPNGHQGGYIRLYNRAYLEGGAAGVVILPELNGKFLLLHHYRHATRSWHWEIPRGFGEGGVTARDRAYAEVKEEIGGEVSELIDLGPFFNNTGLEGNPIQIFLAHLKSVGEPELAEGIEKIRWVDLNELEKMISNAEITDGFTIVAYTRAKLKLLI